ncbi:hypothetical protein MTO96_019514 [Rhipicephalus appendiculatus]
MNFATRISGKNDGRPFYACSACRRRKDCPFFLWKEQASRCGNSEWDVVKRRVLPDSTHCQLHDRYLELLKLKPRERYFCCRTLLSKKDLKKHHSEHSFTNPVSDDDLRRPSRLLRADLNNATKAQYFFSNSTARFVVDMLTRLGFDRVICVGTPTLHEHFRNENPELKSLLLDIEQARRRWSGDRLLTGHRCAVVVDPPFGGLVDAVARTLEHLAEQAATLDCELKVFWFFPYFNEKRIITALPRLRMCDYAVDYENHADFTSDGGKRAKGSPVRIFTDVPLGQIPLPEGDGYTFCAPCDRWVARHNEHCTVCNDCPSKDGGPYRHCERCGVCVKRANEHCSVCDRCLPPGHDCQSRGVTCFACKQSGHKSTECTQRTAAERKHLKRNFSGNVSQCKKKKKRR